eukprot:g8500.t1
MESMVALLANGGQFERATEGMAAFLNAHTSRSFTAFPRRTLPVRPNNIIKTFVLTAAPTRPLSTTASIVLGCATSALVCPFAEWKIHKDIMHLLPPQRKGASLFAKKSSEAHHDEHHKAYSPPAHYYKDESNAHAISTFNNNHIALILTGAATVSGMLCGLHGVLNTGALLWCDAYSGFSCGFVSSTLAYYGMYEFLHALMHDIGRDKIAMGRILGHLIQAGLPDDLSNLSTFQAKTLECDGKLRLSKPLLDAIYKDICDSCTGGKGNGRVENGKRRVFRTWVVEEFKRQVAINRDVTAATVKLRPGEEEASLEAMASAYFSSGWADQRDNLAGPPSRNIGPFWIFLEANIRAAPWFIFLDNHHHVHHLRFWKNLNVVFPLADYVMGTLHLSSNSWLNEPGNIKFWLCPNSPDLSPFVAPRRWRGPVKTRDDDRLSKVTA